MHLNYYSLKYYWYWVLQHESLALLYGFESPEERIRHSIMGQVQSQMLVIRSKVMRAVEMAVRANEVLACGSQTLEEGTCITR